MMKKRFCLVIVLVIGAVCVAAMGDSANEGNSAGLAVATAGAAPTVQATESQHIVPSFQAGNDAAGLHPNHPPIDQIPPIPMPFPEAQPPAGRGALVVHNSLTGETITLPNEAKVSEEFGQGGGYNGADGGGGGTEVLPATFNDMYQVTNTGDFPWRMNCKLVMRFEDIGGGSHWYVASGTMRDAETVLTAGHCVYSQSYGWAKEIWVYPGYNGEGWALPPPYTVGEYGWGHGTYFASWTTWTVDGNFDGDVGMIALTRAVGMLTGWFGYAYGGTCSYHMSLTYNNASYPAEDCPIAGLHNGLDMYYWYGYFDACPNNQLQLNTGGGHCFDTVWGGMSGSGAYFIDGTSRYVHAVCSTSNRTTRGYYCRQWLDWVTYGNNTFIPSVRGSSFDLQALDCNAQPATIEAGQSTTLLNHLATNPTNGTASGTWTYRVYLSSNDNISAADTLLSTQHYSWSFGTMSSIRINMVQVTIPSGTPPGNYWIGLEYDAATDGVSSNNSTDGWDAVPITVTAPSPTPTPTPTASPTPTPAPSPTPTPAPSPTPTPTSTPSPTPTPTPTPSPTPSPTPTPTITPVALIVEDSSGGAGKTNIPVEISLDNAMSVKGVQLTLCDTPNLLTLGSQSPVADTTRASGFTVAAGETAGGCVEVIMVSLTGDLIAPGSGPILTLYYDVDGGATPGTEIDMQPTAFNVADENNDPLPVVAMYGTFTVGDKGDLDGDGDCDIFDVLRQIDIALDKPPAPTAYEQWAGDMDDDGNIDLFDVLALIDCILGITACSCAS